MKNTHARKLEIETYVYKTITKTNGGWKKTKTFGIIIIKTWTVHHSTITTAAVKLKNRKKK